MFIETADGFGSRAGLPAELRSTLARLSKPLGRCQECRRVEANTLTASLALCGWCADERNRRPRTLSVRAARRELTAALAELNRLDLEALEAAR